jgi:hypothetical protein
VPSVARFSTSAALPLAALVAAVSLGGILLPSTYARETASWAAQALGQDWVDLVAAVPWLAITGVLARRGSRRALILLGGGLLFTVYELVIYAFSVRFNSLFLLYCATLGLSLFALVTLLAGLVGQDGRSWYDGPLPRRTVAAFLIGVGGVFGLLWLAEVVPASLRAGIPPSLAEAAVPTNPVHVMDLSFILPLHVTAGVSLARRRPLAYALAPILLAFDALMALSIAGMMVVMRLRGVDAAPAVMGIMACLSAASGILLAQMLQHLRP